MIVISDTTPIISLLKADQLELLEKSNEIRLGKSICNTVMVHIGLEIRY